MAPPTHPESMAALYAANTPDSFWKLLLESPISPEEWDTASRAAAALLPQADHASGAAAVLGETIFGPRRWQLSRKKRLYYQMKPFLPRPLGIFLRKGYRQMQEQQFALGWPVEDRYARFHYQYLAQALRQRGLREVSYLHFWPDAHRFALVLTHDVEEAAGCAFVEEVARLEETLGFRSAFNFVPERYPIDPGLFSSLRQRGFEVGVHGLKHDGKLFFSRRVFEQRAAKINHYIRAWEAVGFRAPHMHRNAEWLQALDIEYDSSFFDTDPYEPMPGGTMSIWPFVLGAFVEMPYTLPQDHTLMTILGERSARLWLKKVDFIEQWRGMALVNTHPDYLRARGHLDIYKQFLTTLKERGNYWHALPGDVARWWQQRRQFQAQSVGGQWNLDDLPGAVASRLVAEEETSLLAARNLTQEMRV